MKKINKSTVDPQDGAKTPSDDSVKELKGTEIPLVTKKHRPVISTSTAD